MAMLDDEQIRELRAVRSQIMEQAEATLNDENFAARAMMVKGASIDMLHALVATGMEPEVAASSVVGMVSTALMIHMRNSAIHLGMAIARGDVKLDGDEDGDGGA